MINVDAKGNPYLMDGTQVNRLTLKALVSRNVLAPCGADLLGQGVAAYTISDALSAKGAES
ncbi:hypothetical protein [Marinobacter alexandrii]|uniref:hypothetical protein n=1 Tax=Marinobacter alexandrii TaxID=2570351 RepID=UPI001109269E|nr:hypothetical protein [Marinobacter alexandrii]